MKHTYLLPLLALVSACADSPADSLAKAETAFAANDYSSAKIYLAAALGQEPNDPKMLLLQAKTLLALGDGEAAAGALARLTKGQKPEPAIARLMAEAELLRGRGQDIEAILTGLSDAEAERLRGLAAIQAKDLNAAAAHFDAAVRAGGNGRAYADYARFRLLSGDVAGAQDMAARAQKADPKGLDTLLVLAQIASQAGQYQQALGHYTSAEKLFPASLAALTGKAAILGELGQLDDMEAVIAQVSKRAPNDRDIVYLNARLAMAREQWTKVRDLVQNTKAEISTSDPLRLIYGEALLQLKQAELAISQIAPIAAQQPNNRAALALLARSKFAAGDAAGALKAIQPVADSQQARPEELALAAKFAKASGDPAATSYLSRAKQPAPRVLASDLAEGDAAIRQGNWAKAVIAYQRIIAATDGKNVLVLNNLAYALSMLGRHTEAVKYADLALKGAPDNASVLDTAGWVRFRSGGDLAESQRLLRMAAEKAPDNLTIRAHLAEAMRKS
jgi:tetratricopeptide (TPR) repeat protein